MQESVTWERKPRAFGGTPLWRQLLLFVLPSLGSSVLQSASTTITSIYLGRLIGVSALAAVSSYFPFGFFLISFIFGLAMASSVLIGQAIGAGNLERVRAVTGTTILVSICIGIVIASTAGLFARKVMEAAATPPDILDDAVAYTRVMLLGQPVACMFLAYNTFLRGTGDSRTPFFALVLATAVSLLLTPALIEGWFGLPRLGTASGAYAAMVGYTVTLVALGLYLRRTGSPLAPDAALMRHLRVDWTILKLLVRLGIPTALQMVMISLSEIAVLSFVNRYGAVATAAYGAVNQVASYVQMPAISVGMAASVFCSQAIGRGEFGRLTRITRTAVAMNVTMCGVTITLAYLFAPTILGWFVVDRATETTALRLLDITLWSYVIFGTTSVLSGVMRSSGTVFWPTSFSIFSIWAVEVPVAYMLSRIIGLDGIWISYPVAFAVALLLQSFYFTVFWRHKSFKRLI